MKRRSSRQVASVLTSLRRGRQRRSLRHRRSRLQNGLVSPSIPASVERLEDRALLTLQFQFTPAPGTPQQMIDGFEEAAGLWKHYLNDDITVNVNISSAFLPPGVIGSTLNTEQPFSFQSVRSALQLDAKSADDVTALSSITNNATLNVYMNLTADNPNGVGSITPYVDNDGGGNNSTISIPRSNAKALGLIPADDPGVDGSIQFSQAFGFDYDRADGITPGQIDFVFVAAHEIGHLLGFVSGVDTLDNLDGQAGRPGPFDDDTFLDISVLDLYRHSTDSLANGADLDFTADNRVKSFSIDGGSTFPGQFATGRNNGDGQQASHWKDSMMMGLLDPTASAGELGVIRSLDVQSFDVIGWDVVPSSLLPDPVIFGTFGDDNFIISINPSDQTQVQIQVNGPVVATYDLALLKSLTIVGLDGDDDVQVDESNGAINLPGGIRVGTVPTLLGPSGVITNARPTFTWTAEPLAESYELVVRDAKGTEVLRRASIPGTSFTALSPLPEGSYTAVVRAFNSFGPTSFSDPVAFAVNIPVPSTPQFLSPQSLTTTSTPRFKWTQVNFASTYQLQVTNRTTGQRFISQTDLTTNEYSHFNPLPDGTYRATVRATNGVGEQSNAGILDFSINAPAPGAPTLTRPSALVTDTLRPRIEWTNVAGADRYDLWVDNIDLGISQFIRQPQLDSAFFIPLQDMPQGRYRAAVRGLTISGKTSRWSEMRDFTIDLPIPDVPTFLSPSALERTLDINFRWTPAALAETYDLWVSNVTTGESVAIRESALNTNQFRARLSEGQYDAWVRSFNAAGESSRWSEKFRFEVDIPTPVAPLPNGPPLTALGLTQDATPTMSWSAVEFAATYDLWVRDDTRGINRIIREMELTEAEFTPTTALRDGRYVFWVRAINESGESSPWSQPYEFVIDTPVPTEPKLNPLPQTSSNRMPLFTWSQPDYAVRYELYIQNITLREFQVVRVRSTQYRPAEALQPGTYRVWVRAFNSSGEHSGWSAPIQFILTDTESEPLPGVDGEPELLLADATDTDVLTGDLVTEELRENPVADRRERGEAPKPVRTDADPTSRKAQPVPSPATTEDWQEPAVAGRQGNPRLQEEIDDVAIEAVMAQWPHHEWWLQRGELLGDRQQEQDTRS